MNWNLTFSQTLSGVVFNVEANQPLEFVNIGIAGKNIGTVSEANGKFTFQVSSVFDSDSVLFSKIGFKPVKIKVLDLKKNSQNKIFMEQKVYELKEIVIKPKIIEERILGVDTKARKLTSGFKDNLLGYECGVLMKVKKSAYIKKVNFNIASCSYDTVFYRLNIYSVISKDNFVNILKEPVYIKISKELLKDEVQIDLQEKNIIVDGDFLVTLEHIKDLGSGSLNFCARLMEKTYFRTTSQGEWKTLPIGISISVLADIEK